MADRPIIFSAPMVRALLDGRKKQTRRAIRGVGGDNCMVVRKAAAKLAGLRAHVLDAAEHGLLPYAVGDRLWVREAWCPSDPGPAYMADHHGDPRGLGWRPSIHMPRWASRLTLVVTEVRVQRLCEITEADALAEGVAWSDDYEGYHTEDCRNFHGSDPRVSFASLWEGIHGDDAWAANPWIVAVSFDVHRCNIDAMKEPSHAAARSTRRALPALRR